MAIARRTDPEFDPPTPGPSRSRDAFDPAEHQRVVVNPFLAVLGLIGLGWLARVLLHSPWPGTAGLLLLSIVLIPRLIQFHCLDCGRTGRYTRRATHACPRVVERWRGGRRARAPFPSGWAQLVAWGWMLGSVALLLAVWAWT